MRPLLLDLYCCEGGASMGYSRAGFDVYGVDLFEDYTQKRYPFASWKGDVFMAIAELATDGLRFSNGQALTLDDFDAIHASPPCQRYSITNAARRHNYPDLVGMTRRALDETLRPYIIENVEGAPLMDPVRLCGRQFGLMAVDDDDTLLHLDRHRLFESNIKLALPPTCQPHDMSLQVAGVYGGARRNKHEARHVRKGGYVPPNKTVAEALLDVDWMTWKGMQQCIPPVYTEFLGAQLLTHLDNTEVAA